MTGGTAPYVYSWNGGATTTSSSISGLAAGATGNVVVTDANGCSATKSYSVGEALICLMRPLRLNLESELPNW